MRTPEFFPLQWIRSYRMKDAGSDALAGITLAAYAIPVSMAYAKLAGLPVHYGIYGYLIGGLFYALFGTGRELAVGPTSAISLMIGTTLAAIAGGDTVRWAELASLTALLVAMISFIAYLLKLNSITNFISESVLLGFRAGAALTIALTQLPMLFGIREGGAGFFERAGWLFNHLSESNYAVILLGTGVLVLLVVGEKLLPGRPVAIVLVILSIILISGTSLADYGIPVAGEIRAGLPIFRLPNLHSGDVEGIVPLAFACFLLACIESISAARTLALRGGYEIDTRQELLAMSVANAATSLGQGFPVSGGLSQSAVNSRAGARTPMSLVFASVVIAVCLIYLTGLLKNLPNVVLACILLVAIGRLVDLKGLKRLWKISRMEFSVAVIAFLSVLFFGILKGGGPFSSCLHRFDADGYL